MSQKEEVDVVLPGKEAEALLSDIAGWGNVTTIIIHAGCVFEFKGPFPKGRNAEGYYNLQGAGHGAAAGFEGHLKLAGISDVALQAKQHRGRDSYSFVFTNGKGELVFKVFLGREDSGDIISSQLEAFTAMQTKHSI